MEVDVMLRRPEVERRVGLSRSALYHLMSCGLFPRPSKIGPRAVAWSAATIADWLAQRPIAEGRR